MTSLMSCTPAQGLVHGRIAVTYPGGSCRQIQKRGLRVFKNILEPPKVQNRLLRRASARSMSATVSICINKHDSCVEPGLESPSYAHCWFVQRIHGEILTSDVFLTLSKVQLKTYSCDLSWCISKKSGRRYARVCQSLFSLGAGTTAADGKF
jgi:hypothetical protein